MNPDLEGPAHRRCSLRQVLLKPRRYPLGGGAAQVQKIEKVFEQQRVIHRAAFLVAAISADL